VNIASRIARLEKALNPTTCPKPFSVKTCPMFKSGNVALAPITDPPAPASPFVCGTCGGSPVTFNPITLCGDRDIRDDDAGGGDH
jgi:hypothetical protein